MSDTNSRFYRVAVTSLIYLVAIAGAFFAAVNFLQREDRGAADFGIFVEKFGEPFEVVSAAPANVVRDDFDVARAGCLFAQRRGLTRLQ